MLIEYPSGKTGEAYTIPDSVTDIGYAFAGNAQLKNITIPESITGLDYGAFIDCTSLESIDIPESVTRIGGIASENADCQTTPQCVFQGCSSLKNINVAEGNPAYVSVDGVLFNKERTKLLIYPAGKTDMSYVIPESVTYIEYNAFSNCAGLTSVTLPSGVTCIEADTFSGCTGLTSVTIPVGVTSIGSSAFSGCTSLKRIEIPNSVTSIGGRVFYDCASLTSITIPNGVTSIAYEAFGGCTGLVSITIPNSVTSIYELAFYDCASLTDVYYTGTEEQWNAIDVWYVNDYLLNAAIHYNYHEHVTQLRNAVEPTCTETGYTGDEVCSICGEVISQGETIDATGHHYKGNTCTDCGATRSTADTIRAWFQDTISTVKNLLDKLFGKI